MTLPGWRTYQKIAYTACDQADYQQDIVIHRTIDENEDVVAGPVRIWHVYVGGKCRIDYGDIRFTDGDENPLPYHLVAGSTETEARFRVRIPNADDDGEILVWYGNAGATTTSNGYATYPFFDDGSVGVPTDRWEVVAGSPTISYTGGKIQISVSPPSPASTIVSKNGVFDNCIVTARMWVADYDDGTAAIIGRWADEPGHGYCYTPRDSDAWCMIGYLAPGGGLNSIAYDYAVLTSWPGSPDEDTALPHQWGVSCIGQALSGYHNGRSILSASDSEVAPPGKVGFWLWPRYGSGVAVECDSIEVLTYSADPPTVSEFFQEVEAPLEITITLEIQSSSAVALATAAITTTHTTDCDSPSTQPALTYTRVETILSNPPSVTYYCDLDDTLPLDDALLLDGAQQLLCTDHLPLSDEIEERTLKDHLILEDTLPLTEEFPSTAYLSDRLHLSDEFRTKHIPPGGVFSISGTQWMPGSELPCAGATIHLIKRYSNLVLVDLVDLFDELELVHSRDGSTLSSEVIDGGTEPGDPPAPAREIIPPGNAPEYLTTTDDYGFFHMEDIPEGKYVLVAMKPGYSVDIQQVDLAEDVYVASMMYPVSTWGLIERPYDERGNILKMYLYGDVVDGEDRIVDGIVVFGDLYGTAIEPSGATPIVPGHLSVIDRFVIGTIDIVDTPILGRIGFFEAATETLDVNPDHTIITWNAAGPKGDFDGFCFRYRFHHLMTGVLTLSLFSRVVVPETTSSGSPSSPSSPSSPGSPGTTGNQPNWGGNWNTYTPTTHVPWKPKWSPYFGVGLSDGLRVHSPASTRQTGVVKRIAFSETVGVSAVSVTPPRLSMTGVAVSDAGKAVSGATVVIKARRTGRVVAETTTAENGLWRVTGLESELIYDVLIFEPESPTVYSSGGSIQVLDRDIVDNRALMLVEDIVYRDDGSNQYIDFRIILPPHGTRLDADGRAYGEVINKFTREPVIGALVEVYPGTLDVDDLETYSGQIFAYRTHEREYVTDGFYEVYLPGGSYTLRVTASGYADSELYHFTIQAGGWERDIELVRGTVIGHVYDALDHSAGIQTPIEGAIVSVGDTEVVTGDDGSYTIMSAVDSRTGEATCIVACSNVDYVTAEKRVRVTGMDATRLNFYLWRVQQYHHQTT